MKADTTRDIQGRLLSATFRVAVISEALTAFAQKDDGFVNVNTDALWGLGSIADEIASELKAIEDESVRQEDLLYKTIADVCGEVAGQTVQRRMAEALWKAVRDDR